METINESRWPRDTGGESAPAHVVRQALTSRLEEIARLFRENPFVPHPYFRGGHAQTIAASLRLPRRRELRDERRHYEQRIVETEPGARLLLECRWQAKRQGVPTLLLIHGLEGSSDSLYMRGTARKAYAAGMNVACMNMRNCGGTDDLNQSLYNSGMTGDIHSVIADELAGREGLEEIFVAGFSMSGNMVLRLAGDYGSDAPRALAGVVAVSPSIDLDDCARAIEMRENIIYRWSFMRALRRRVRNKGRLHPSLYDTRGLVRVRTIRQFDERFTAPHGGYRDADDYYERASSFRVIGRISLPTLILHADDDPLIPSGPFRDPSIANNPNVLLILTPGGGHVGFIGDAREGEDRRWAENRVVEFCRALAGGRQK
ncbi:MAG TPA: alpha/beta fold hydrolase [Pyrinomonadaceae bacterium]|nr:alpha/beta fold hydrolase [Pyrinomonadaceae bacterium]